jgi:outer membrane protein assembly factor BamB
LWLKDGSLVNKFKVKGNLVLGTPTIVDSDGTVVVGDDMGNLYWLNEGTAKRRMEVTYKKPDSTNVYGMRFLSSLIAFRPDYVVAVGSDSELIWVEAGEVKYRIPVTNYFNKNPAYLRDGSVVNPEAKSVVVYR